MKRISSYYKPVSVWFLVKAVVRKRPTVKFVPYAASPSSMLN